MGRTSTAWLLAATALLGCDAERPGAGAAAGALNEPARELVSIETVWKAPRAADGAPRHRLGWREADGHVRPIDLPAPATAWTVWRGDAVTLDARRRLWRIAEGEPPRRIAEDVGSAPAASPDGARLAYAVAADPRAELRVHDGRTERVVARATATAGLLTWSTAGETIAFVGAGDGGVAGVWVARVDGEGARCLTNCELVTSEPWGDRFVPLPRTAEELRLQDDGTVRWALPGGGTVSRRWRGGTR